MKNSILHLENPAYNWENASPVGCGSAGMMVFGGVDEDRISLNEESIWSGGPMETRVEGYMEKIKYLRQLFMDNREEEADGWARENMGGCFNRIKSYEYAGNILVKPRHPGEAEAESYSRDIDLINGILSVTYTRSGINYTREYFASYPDGLLCASYSSTAEFDADILYTRENLISLTCSDEGITADGRTAEGDNRFRVTLKIKTDGIPSGTVEGISVKSATYIELYTVITTSHKSNLTDTAAVEKAVRSGWTAVKSAHTADFSAVMTRSSLCLNDENEAELAHLPVNKRLDRLKSDPSATDNSLISLYWNFAKYLLVSSSRPGTLPANLQGVWADGLTPPWNSDYHTNINLQMNYWQAEAANLSDCTEPLFSYMNNYLLPGGKKVARENYNINGMVVHHLSDIYGFAAAADGLWGLWQVGGAWLAYHMWDHYLYTGDTDFLKNTAYPFIRECVDFFADFMFEGSDGYMHTGPSTSPENRYFKDTPEGKKEVYLALSPTMDIEIVGGLFDFYAQTEKILGIDPDNAEKIKKIRSKMPPLRIGRRGQLMEWLRDYDEVEPGHRHVSHAFALYPGYEINHSTPELMAAIERTLELRLASGGGHTGWSRAWLINLFARLWKGDKAYENMRALLTKSTLPNLFDTHPPFQIDGNFGGGAGISEMVMQSHEGYIALLPALPKNISGSFSGLAARGGIVVSAEWEKGRVTRLTLKSPDGQPKTVKVRLPEGNGGETLTFDVQGEKTVEM